MTAALAAARRRSRIAAIATWITLAVSVAGMILRFQTDRYEPVASWVTWLACIASIAGLIIVGRAEKIVRTEREAIG